MVPFTEDGRLDIDNGSAERYLRRVASGRNSWLFAGSHNGARRFADVLSLVSTADAVGLDAGRFLPSVISNVDTWPNNRIDELLPHKWKAAFDQFGISPPQLRPKPVTLDRHSEVGSRRPGALAGIGTPWLLGCALVAGGQ